MKLLKATFLLSLTLGITLMLTNCAEDPVEPQITNGGGDGENGNNEGGNDIGSPRYTGDINALFVGHSAMNDIVDDYVRTLAQTRDNSNNLTIATATSGDISLVGKMDREEVRPIFQQDNHNYDFAVLTEQWDYQNYNPSIHGADDNNPVTGCPPSGYDYADLWENPEDDWVPIPFYLQQYVDGMECGNGSSETFYYQTWTLDYNEVTNGTTRQSDPDYQRPTVDEMITLIQNGQANPDLAAADRIEFEGVKWEHFVRSINRPDVIFIPAGFAMARLIREIEAGQVPGFEAVANSNGIAADGRLAWVDWIFYNDGYHLSTVGHYFVSLVIYASVYNESPEGIEIGSGNYGVSEAFFEDQYPLEGISNQQYQDFLNQTGANGIYDLRGHNSLDYIHEDLRIYLQRLAWDVVQNDSDYSN